MVGSAINKSQTGRIELNSLIRIGQSSVIWFLRSDLPVLTALMAPSFFGVEETKTSFLLVNQ